MKQVLKIPTKTKVPNPGYSPIAKKRVKEQNVELKAKDLPEQTYDVPEEIDEKIYTTAIIEGVPNIVTKISDFIFKAFNEVE